MATDTQAVTRMSLYDVALEGMQLEEILTANDGELTPELEERFDRLLREGPHRIEAAAMAARSLESDAAVCETEAARLKERAASLTRQAKRLKERMTLALDAAFGGKVKTALFTIWTQKAPDSLAIDLAAEFTAEQLREEYPGYVKTECSLNRAAIREVWEMNAALLRHANEILADPKSGEKEQELAREALSLIPDGIVIEEKAGGRYCRIR